MHLLKTFGCAVMEPTNISRASDKHALGPALMTGLLESSSENRGAQLTHWWCECLGRPDVVPRMSVLSRSC
jgi:hypothetical protein